MENTKIEWAHHTFNPWIGCQKVGPGCDHCYAEKERATTQLGVKWGAHELRHRTAESNWKKPLTWNREAARLGIRYRVFCASLADVFDNAVPSDWRLELFELIRATPNLDWLLLTKRIGNAKAMIEAAVGHMDIGYAIPFAAWPWPNVWLGITVVNREEANRDIPKLLAVPAAKRFLSMEPLLGPVDVARWMPCSMHLLGCTCAGPFLDWVIVGGESGPQARPMHPDWARGPRDRCAHAGVPFLFKQWGTWIPSDQEECPCGPPLSDWTWADGKPFTEQQGPRDMPLFRRVGKVRAGRLLDGVEHNEYPE